MFFDSFEKIKHKARCDAALKKIDRKSRPTKLRDVHHWQTKINDRRLKENPRANLKGRYDRLTGIDVHACKLPFDPVNRVIAKGNKNPVYLNWEQTEEEPEDADEAAIQTEMDRFIAQNTSMYQGWKVSYRKGAVEKMQITKVGMFLIRRDRK